MFGFVIKKFEYYGDRVVKNVIVGLFEKKLENRFWDCVIDVFVNLG